MVDSNKSAVAAGNNYTVVDSNKSAVADGNNYTVVDGDCNNPPWWLPSTATTANGNNVRGRTATIRWSEATIRHGQNAGLKQQQSAMVETAVAKQS
jgi:hypothetical protein